MEKTIKPLSFSQIALYQSCPLGYKLRYIDGLKPKDKWYFSFGSTLHLCVEYFFRVNVPPPPSLDQLLQFCDQNWLPNGYESGEEELKYKAYGKEILRRFWEIHGTDFRMPIAVEKPFYIDINGVKLRGYIDRVDKLESGGLAIVDYKTNKDLFTNDYLEEDLQLTLYQAAAEEIWQLPVHKLTLYHLRSNTPCSCGPRDGAHLEQARRLVREVAENIASQKFPAVENQNCPCDFPEYCPYFRQRYITPEPPHQEILPGLAVADAVESYVCLQDQIKELQPKLDEIKERIISFCQSQELKRVYGYDHAITYNMVERTVFSEDDVKEILQMAGLWERVLSLDQSRLKQLLADDSLPTDIRRKLEALRRVIPTYPQLRVRKMREED